MWVKAPATFPTTETTLISWGNPAGALQDFALTFYNDKASGAVRHGGVDNDMGWWGGATVSNGPGTVFVAPPTNDWTHVVYTYTPKDGEQGVCKARSDDCACVGC